MKQSIFNSRVKITDSTDLLYNAYSDRFMLIRKEVPVSIDDNCKNYSDFEKGGFIVEDNVDEIEAVKKLSEKEDFRKDVFMLIVNPTLNCNFSCWYCYEQKNIVSEMKETTLSSLKSLIDNICDKYETLHLSFFGGEPLLKFSKIVKPLMDYAEKVCDETQCNLYFSFTTNGSIITSQMIEYFVGKNILFQITVDGGKTTHDNTRGFKNGKGSYDIILKNVCNLLKHHHRVILRINYTDKNINAVGNIIDDIIPNISDSEKDYLQIALHQVWQNSNIDLSKIVSNQKAKLLSAGFDVSLPLFDNVRNSCYGDKVNSVVVNYNGDLFKCTAVDFINTKREGYLDKDGKLVWEDDSLNKRMRIKFTNKPCLNCRILPICNGACSQKHFYSEGHDFCVLGFSEEKKDKAILDKFERYIENLK